MKSNRRFNRVTTQSGLDGASLLGKRAATHTETESSLLSKRACNQSPVVPQLISVPQNHSQIVAEVDNSLQWNVRQNSFSDLLLKHFNVSSQSGNNIKMKCKLCGERRRPISTVLGNNSNLKKHIQAVRNFALYLTLLRFLRIISICQFHKVHPMIFEELTEENIMTKNTEKSTFRQILTTVTEKQVEF